MVRKSVIADSVQIQLAMQLIELGARLQLLETETTLSRERLLKLYKEMRGKSPPKGMLPFSADWFMTWQPNIHASLFLNIYRYLQQHAQLRGIEAVIKAFQLYLEQLPPASGEAPLLSLTRAWTLVRFYDSKMLRLVECSQCHGHFVGHALDLHQAYRCGLCHSPSRAGKKKKIIEAEVKAP
ncbi:MAG: flagellar transcriptional regulator FlhC [Pseudomonadota bacterium]|nr:flagellar transcriptional regulator FlhC [Oxalobacteraceae bacterium]